MCEVTVSTVNWILLRILAHKVSMHNCLSWCMYVCLPIS